MNDEDIEALAERLRNGTARRTFRSGVVNALAFRTAGVDKMPYADVVASGAGYLGIRWADERSAMDESLSKATAEAQKSAQWEEYFVTNLEFPPELRTLEWMRHIPGSVLAVEYIHALHADMKSTEARLLQKILHAPLPNSRSVGFQT